MSDAEYGLAVDQKPDNDDEFYTATEVLQTLLGLPEAVLAALHDVYCLEYVMVTFVRSVLQDVAHKCRYQPPAVSEQYR